MQHRTIDDYIDAAKKAQGIASDNGLARRLGITTASLNGWRKKRSWPKDIYVIELAELSGLDAPIALQELNSWRAEGKAKLCYQRIAEKLAAIAAILLIFLGFSTAAQAGTLAELGNIIDVGTVYYGKLYVIFCY